MTRFLVVLAKNKCKNNYNSNSNSNNSNSNSKNNSKHRFPSGMTSKKGNCDKQEKRQQIRSFPDPLLETLE